jgi:tripartite-type tricarboxylate transporter receptor subunit TctC
MLGFTRRAVAVAAAIGASVLATGPAAAQQQWPARPIEIAVWASAGGGTDFTNRLIARAMERHLGGTRINVQNRTGGGGAVAMNHVWTQPREGYSWLGASEAMQNTAVMGFHPSVTRDWNWFMVAGSVAVLAVHPDSPHRTVQDFVAAAQRNPGRVRIGHCALGCVWHLKSLSLADASESRFNLVPYEGSGPAITAAMSREVDGVMAGLAEVTEHIRGGRLRPIGMIEMEPFEFPGVGTIPAAGTAYPRIAQMPARQWLGFALPADTPAPVMQRVTTAFEQAMQDPEVLRGLEGRMFTRFGQHGAEAQRILQAMESAVSWKLQELGMARVNPEQLRIPRP